MRELITKAKEGDTEAVNAIVDELKERIERMAKYYAVCCGEDAGDLGQEAWLGVLEALKHVDVQVGDPRHYLVRHAKWRLLDFVKWSKRRQHDALDGLEDFEAFDVESTAVDSAYCEQFLSRLNHRQQTLLGYLLSGYTWREAGEKLGCTSANIAYHIRQIQQAYLRWSDDGSLAMGHVQSTKQLAACPKSRLPKI
jgi:RNA polymerase sigma factor (sigma-70 family)